MKTAIMTLSLATLIQFGTAARAAEDLDKNAFAGIPGIELGARLNVGAEARNEVQPASETVSETAAAPQPPKRKVRIVYPLPR